MANPGWKGPRERWDKHSRPLARTALHDARKQGWWLKKSSGSAKVWGVITCSDPNLPKDQRCTMSVLSTSGPADGSETAACINRAVDSCVHARASVGTVDAIAEAQKLVTAANHCLDSARALIAASGHRDFVEDYLAQSELALADADQFLDQALAEEELASVAHTAASEAAAAAGTTVGIGVEGLSGRATAQAGQAHDLIEDDPSRDARILKHRCENIRAEAKLLLASLR